MRRTLYSAALIVGLLTSGSTQKTEKDTKLASRARAAKEQGVSRVELASTLGPRPRFSDIAEVLRFNRPFIVELVSQKTLPSPSGTGIWTWNKFRIVRELSSRKLPADVEGPKLSYDLPAGFNPQVDEIVIPVAGGEAEVDGVFFSQRLRHDFKFAQSYLLLVDFRGLSGDAARVEKLGLKDGAVYLVNSNGVLNQAANRQPPMQFRLDKKFGTVSKLEAFLLSNQL